MAAISGGVGGGMTEVAGGSSALAGSGTGATMARAAIGNAMTQGISVAVGLQKEFNWTSVAASAVGAGVGAALNDSIMGAEQMGPSLPGQSMQRVGGLVGDMGGGAGAQLFGASLKGFAAGVATSMARGGRVEVTQIAADAFGNALGESWGESLKSQGTQETKLAAVAKENQQREETQAAAFDALTNAFDSTRSMPSYGPGVLVADAGGYVGDEVVSDAGGDGGTSASDDDFDLDNMRAQFGPDAITGPDPAPQQPSLRDSNAGRATTGKNNQWKPELPELGSKSDYLKRADEHKRYAEQMQRYAAEAEKLGDAKIAAEFKRMEAGYLNAAAFDQGQASNIQTHTRPMWEGVNPPEFRVPDGSSYMGDNSWRLPPEQSISLKPNYLAVNGSALGGAGGAAINLDNGQVFGGAGGSVPVTPSGNLVAGYIFGNRSGETAFRATATDSFLGGAGNSGGLSLFGLYVGYNHSFGGVTAIEVGLGSPRISSKPNPSVGAGPGVAVPLFKIPGMTDD